MKISQLSYYSLYPGSMSADKRLNDRIMSNSDVRNATTPTLKAVYAILASRELPPNMRNSNEEIISFFQAKRSSVYKGLRAVLHGREPCILGRPKFFLKSELSLIDSRFSAEFRKGNALKRKEAEALCHKAVCEVARKEITSPRKRASPETVRRTIARLKIKMLTKAEVRRRQMLPTRKCYEECFLRLQEQLRKNDYSRSFIFNMDESHCINNECSKKEYVYFRGKGAIRQKNKNPSSHVTIVSCISASGWSIYPTFILRKDLLRQEKFTEVGREPPIYIDSPSGWMTNDLIVQWAREVFIRQVTPFLYGRRALLIMDGHSTHKNKEFLKVLDENGIDVFFLPPNATQFFQPLDMGVFSQFKDLLSEIGLSSGLEKTLMNSEVAWSKCLNVDVIVGAWKNSRLLCGSLNEFLEGREFGPGTPPRLKAKKKKKPVKKKVRKERKKKKISPKRRARGKT